MLETALGYSPKFEQDLTFMNLFREVTSKNGANDLILLSKDELRLLHHRSECLSPALSDLEITDIQSLQCYLKNLQENGTYSVNSNFDYCSIESEVSSDFWTRDEDTLDDGQDSRPSASKTIEFPQRKPHSSDILPYT